MALTITQQLMLMSGEVNPPSNNLMVLVHQTAFVKAKQTYDGYKEFDGTANPEAQRYLDKMLAVSSSVFRNQGEIISQLTRIVVAIIGASAYTLAQIQSANDTAWEGFILDQMDESFEYLGGVKKDEKDAYTNLP